MNIAVRTFKRLLTQIGARLSAPNIRRLQATWDYVRIGRWMREQGIILNERRPNRQSVWDKILTQVHNEKVLYLEFAVAEGNSIAYWSRELKHPEAMLRGFESFEGLPEAAGPWSKGQFDQHG